MAYCVLSPVTGTTVRKEMLTLNLLFIEYTYDFHAESGHWEDSQGRTASTNPRVCAWDRKKTITAVLGDFFTCCLLINMSLSSTWQHLMKWMQKSFTSGNMLKWEIKWRTHGLDN